MYQIYEQNFDYIRAPQNITSQILWLLNNEKIDIVYGNLISAFIYHNLKSKGNFKYSQIILNIDFENNIFKFIDIDLLAEKLNTTCDLLALSICQTYLLSFFLKYQKFSFFQELSTKKIQEGKIFWQEKKSLNKELIKLQIKQNKDENPKFTQSWKKYILWLSDFLKIDQNTINNVQKLFFSCPVITPEMEFPSFPGKKHLQKIPFKIDINWKKELTVLYCLGFMNEQVFQLINDATQHSISIFPFFSESFQ